MKTSRGFRRRHVAEKHAAGSDGGTRQKTKRGSSPLRRYTRRAALLGRRVARGRQLEAPFEAVEASGDESRRDEVRVGRGGRHSQLRARTSATRGAAPHIGYKGSRA
eukprot:1420275-Prymnesium_polylepis.1